MSSPLGDLTPHQFLDEYWQKKPCIIRRAIDGFEPLLDADDLAGLACEEMAESRLILGSAERANWEVRHGPFEESEFARLPQSHWTLLVQDVEKHYAPLQELMQLFDFIPSWRLDDLMISYAAPGGSVGPHVDQYDVFLLQAAGTRRWQIAENFNPQLLDDCPLNVLLEFNPEQEWTLEAGDMLYLPPNVAHHGVAITAGMTWSIGARAPSAADLLQALGEWLAMSDNQGGRFSDPQLEVPQHAGEIDAEALQGLRATMLSAIKSDHLNEFMGRFISRFRLAQEPAEPPESMHSGDVWQALNAGETLFRNPWTRLVWVERAADAAAHSTDTVHLFAAGNLIDCERWLAQALCQRAELQIDTGRLNQTSLDTLTCLINTGHYIFI